MGGDDGQHRLECEAREWLRRLGRDPKRIKAKLRRIEEVRGKDAANELAEAMRKEWSRGIVGQRAG